MTSITMAPADAPARRDWRRTLGWAMSGLATLFYAADGIMKFVQPPQVTETTAAIGWPNDPATLVLLGVLLLVPTLLYVIPRTSILGAVLITAYLGGAVATHVRIDSPLFSHILFGVYLGLLTWGGLWLRDARLRAIFPLRKD